MFEELLAFLKANPKRVALIGSSLILIVGSWMFFRPPPAERLDRPGGYTFICQNPACRNEFKMSASQAESYRAKHPGEPMRCPKCGQSKVIDADAKPRPTGPIRSR